jgi:hypothetical protein
MCAGVPAAPDIAVRQALPAVALLLRRHQFMYAVAQRDLCIDRLVLAP